MILGLTGTIGAGKGAAVEHLKSNGFTHYSVRDEITQEIERRGLPVDRPRMNQVGTDLRKEHGPAYFPELFMNRAAAAGVTDAVIESIRNPKEADYIKANGGFIIVIDADEKLRYERVMARKSPTDQVSFDEFRAQEAREMRSEDPSDPSYMDMGAVIAMADATVRNEGTLEELGASIDAALAALKA